MDKNIKQNLKNKIKKVLLKFKLKFKMSKIRSKYGYCIIFISVPIHGNLGDQAIVYSQYKFFESIGLKENIIEIRSCDFNMFNDVIQEYIIDKDVIVIDGGGNMGTLWIEEEYRIREIIKKYNKNKIIIFPETVYYSNDEFGAKEFEISKEVYKKHENLYICVRDINSYNLIKEEYKPACIEYVPDIVLYLDILSFNEDRKDAILCIRKDKEKIIDTQLIKKIEKKLSLNNIRIKYSTTVIEKLVRKKDRERELYIKWKEFASAKIVITDRLHGMIFSVITGTPCIALNNSNGKVKGVYEWIRELPYVIFCDDNSNIEESIDKLLKMENNMYSDFRNKNLFEKFNPIIKMIKE